MFPHVQHEQRDRRNGHILMLIKQLERHQALRNCVPCEHCPAGTLQTGRSCGELSLECVERSEEFLDGFSQLAFRLAAAVRRHVLPENRVVGVATEVERQILLQLVDRGEVALLLRFGKLFEGGVSAGHICVVMLVVVQLHNLAGNVRFQRGVVVRKIRQCISRHGSSLALDEAICHTSGP